MELQEILMKLIGPIQPVGDSAIDSGRYENLGTLLDLMAKLHIEVDRISTECKDSPEGSVAKAGKRANAYLEWLGVKD